MSSTDLAPDADPYPVQGNARRESHAGFSPPTRRPYQWNQDNAGNPLRQRLPNWLHKEDVETILTAAKADRSRWGLRNFILLALLYYYGMRPGEAGGVLLAPKWEGDVLVRPFKWVGGIKVCNVDLREEMIWIPRLKGGKSRRYPLHPSLLEPLDRYIPCRPLPSDLRLPVPSNADFLFPSKDLVHIDGRAPFMRGLCEKRVHGILVEYATATEVTAKYEAQFGPGYVRGHSFRHSIATHLLDAGWKIADVQAHLGLVSIDSALVYAQITDQRINGLIGDLPGNPAIAKF